MRKNICLGMGIALALAAGANAASFKVNKVGSEEEQSFDLLLNNKVVSEATPGSWLYVSPIVPSGKMFKSFAVYDEYGETADSQKLSTAAIKELRFLMPNHDVYVKAYYESLRYYIYVGEAINGSVAVSFSDRMDIKDRTKPGFKVTVTPTAAAGYKVSSIKVSKYLDSKTTVTCTKSEASAGGGMWPGMGPAAGAASGGCVFEMPNFDVDVSATFVEESAAVSEVDLKDKKFKVTYELNGGKVADDAASSFACDAIAKLPTPTKVGFDFVGWSFENKLDNVYHALDRIDGNICKDTTVYAIWTATGTCPEQKAVVVDGAKMPVCHTSTKCALFHDSVAKQDSVCNGIVWTSDLSLLPSSSSAAPVSSSSSVASSSSATPSSSSVVASSSSAKPASSSSVVASSSSAKPASSSSVKASSSSAKPASSSSVKASSSSAKPASSSSVKASSSSAKPASSSSVKASSSSAKPASSSSVKASSSSAKPASSSSAKDKSSSSKAKSSSSSEVVVEAVETEEDLPSCTEKRENVTFYVSKLKKVFVCKDRKWTVFDPSGIPTIVHKPSFSAVVNGRSVQISGAKIGSQVSLFDMQGRVMYNGKINASNFSLNVARSGSFLLRIGSQQKVVDIR